MDKNIEQFSVTTHWSNPPRNFQPGNDFYIYNYYKVPITVKVVPKTPKNSIIPPRIITVVENVEAGKRKGVKIDDVINYITNGATILVETYSNNNFVGTVILGKTIMTIPPNTSIRALHCGMVTAHDDFSDSSLLSKSPLGTALSHVRLINLTPRYLTLTTTGSNKIIIPPNKSYLYRGQYENGVAMGTLFRDVDKYLPDYELTLPVTDIFMGLISDLDIPLYRGSKLSGAYFDDPGVNYHPLEIDPTQWHRGLLIDPYYIPKNW